MGSSALRREGAFSVALRTRTSAVHAAALCPSVACAPRGRGARLWRRAGASAQRLCQRRGGEGTSGTRGGPPRVDCRGLATPSSNTRAAGVGGRNRPASAAECAHCGSPGIDSVWNLLNKRNRRPGSAEDVLLMQSCTWSLGREGENEAKDPI
jgi:hypothetical protein